MNLNAINTGQEGEWDWVIQNNVAPTGTFFFRMVKSGGTPLNSYTNFPEITTAGPTFNQEDYRWFTNTNNKQPGAALAAENTAFESGKTGTIYRARMNVEVGTVDVQADSLAFKLQFSTSTGGSWTDVGGFGDPTIWRGFDNANPASDGATISTLLLTSSDVGGSYEEENPSVLNPNAISTGQRGEWDWVLDNTGATGDTTFFFRMVKSDGTPLDGTTNFPTITTLPDDVIDDDFESGGTSGGTGWTGAWTLAGDASVISQGSPHQGSFHLRLRRGTGVATREVDLSGKSGVQAQFWAKADSFETGETATFEISTDDSSYTVLHTWVEGDDDNVYHFHDIAIPNPFISSTTFIRYQANMTQAGDRFYIDDITIIADN